MSQDSICNGMAFVKVNAIEMRRNQTHQVCRKQRRIVVGKASCPPSPRIDLLVKSNPSIAVVAGLSLCLGWVLASLYHRRVLRSLRSLAQGNDEASGINGTNEARKYGERPEPIDIDNLLLALLPSVWCSFRENAATLAIKILQPVLDDIDRPKWIRRVEFVALSLGSEPPSVGRADSLSSKDWSSEQCCFRFCLAGDMRARINVHICVPFMKERYISIPVTVANIVIDARVWLGLERSRSMRQVRAIHWALLDVPYLELNGRICNFLPVDAAPGLSSIVRKMLLSDVPAAFLFPKTRSLQIPGHDEGKLST